MYSIFQAIEFHNTSQNSAYCIEQHHEPELKCYTNETMHELIATPKEYINITSAVLAHFSLLKVKKMLQ